MPFSNFKKLSVNFYKIKEPDFVVDFPDCFDLDSAANSVDFPAYSEVPEQVVLPDSTLSGSFAICFPSLKDRLIYLYIC